MIAMIKRVQKKSLSLLLVLAMLTALLSGMTLAASATFANTGYKNVKTDGASLTGFTAYYDVTGSAISVPARISVNTVSFDADDLMNIGNYYKDHPSLTDWQSTMPDCGFVTWVSVDGNPTYNRASSGHTEEVTVTIPSGKVPLTDGQSYTVILWAKYNGRVYPDAQLFTFTAGKGDFTVSSAGSSATEMVSAANWKTLQSNYQVLVAAYDEIAELYNSDQTAADKNVESAMAQAKKLLEQMGEIDQATLTAADAETLNSAMVDMAEALDTIYDSLTTSASPQNPFTDVKSSDYFYDAVLWAKDKGVTAGTSATTFGPSNTCTRGQVVTFLWNAMGKPEPSTKTNPFTDVKSSDYFYKPVLWAVEKGITAGTSATTFGPNNTCTGAQIITFVWNANGKPASGGASSPYYAKAVAWAEGRSLLDNTSFAAEKPSPRADIVTFLYRNANQPTTLVSDADWKTLQSNYQTLVDDYDAVAAVYNSDQIKADKTIEAAMSAAYDLIKTMGEIDRSGLSAVDAKALNDAMVATQKLLVEVINAMEAA